MWKNQDNKYTKVNIHLDTRTKIFYYIICGFNSRIFASNHAEVIGEIST